jgi:hypothetical protein
MPQIMPLDMPEDHAVGPGEAGTSNFKLARPTCRTVCGRCLRLPSPPYRHPNAAMIEMIRPTQQRMPLRRTLLEHRHRRHTTTRRRPAEDRSELPREFKPGVAELGLIAEPPCRPLRRSPRRDQYDGQDTEIWPQSILVADMAESRGVGISGALRLAPAPAIPRKGLPDPKLEYLQWLQTNASNPSLVVETRRVENQVRANQIAAAI